LEEGCSFKGLGVCLASFSDRLPSKVNLFQRGTIPHDSQLCVSGCGLHESENHLFFICRMFGHIWQLVRKWLCVYSADPSNIQDHFHQFHTSAGYAKSRCSFMHLIWFASSWVIWKEEMIDFFVEYKILLFRLWKVLSFFPFGGLKPITTLFF
jgi:hypothetical protein